MESVYPAVGYAGLHEVLGGFYPGHHFVAIDRLKCVTIRTGLDHVLDRSEVFFVLRKVEPYFIVLKRSTCEL